MPTSISPIAGLTRTLSLDALQPTKPQPNAEELKVRQKFQEFVAGTFYQTLLKSLRSTVHKPAYFHGGQAEEIFQGQMDQVISENLSRDQGAVFADSLFDVYARQHGVATGPTPPAPSLDLTA